MQSRCRECHAEYTRANYQANKQAYKDKARRNNALYFERTTNLIRTFLSTHPCVDCGNSDIRVLQFDHRDHLEKIANIGDMMRRGLSTATLEAEIAKCDVRCANCHSIRTCEQFGWWRNAGIG